MEPALDERGDLNPVAAYPVADHVAAMEPALDERGDGLRAGARGHRERPQWSPLSTSGATCRRRRRRLRSWRRNGARSRRAGRPARTLPRGRPAHAAMEPALDERGDHPRRPERLLRRAGAAMEPALDERGDRQTSSESVSTYRPQWSPLSTSGATWTYIRQAS